MKDFYWLNEDSRTFLSRGYLSEGETPESRIRDIANKAEEYLNEPGFADKFYEYMARGFYSLASPVWANYGKERGLPVSCFGSYIDDSMQAILFGHAENGMLMKNGGGTSGYFGNIRHRALLFETQASPQAQYTLCKCMIHLRLLYHKVLFAVVSLLHIKTLNILMLMSFWTLVQKAILFKV